MSDPQTTNPDQLPLLAGVPADFQVLGHSPGGPLQRVPHDVLLAKVIAADLVKPDRATLLADLAHDEHSVALVHSDPDPLKNGWYRKTGASGAGTWTLFENLTAAVRQAIEDAAEVVVENTDLARQYAIAQLDESIPGAVDAGDRGARYYSFLAKAAVDAVAAVIATAIGTAAATAAAQAADGIEAEMQGYREDALNASAEALYALNTLDTLNFGLSDYQPTRAAATAAIGTYQVGNLIRVAADEDTESGGPSILRVVAGPAFELVDEPNSYRAGYSPATRQRTVVERLSSEIYFEDVLTKAERAAVYAGTADFDAGARLQALINDTSGYMTAGNFSSGRIIRLPAGKLRFMTPVNLKHSVIICGEGRNDNANLGNTVISCDQGVEAFVANFHTTWNDGADDGTYGGTSAMEGWVRDMTIRSEESWDETVAARLGKINGVRVRVKSNLFNVHIHNFPGAGIHQYNAASTSFDDRRGNGNYATYDKIKVTSCTIGYYVDGGDANVVRIGFMDLRNNKVWGYLTGCLLGNHIGTIHAAFNGNSEMASAFHKYARWLFRGGTIGPFGMSGTINATGGNSEPGINLPHWQLDLPADSNFSGNWDAGTAYAENIRLFHNARRWWSKQAVPAGTEPGTDGGVYWEDFGELDAALGYTTFVRYQPGVTTGAKKIHLGLRWTAVSTSAASKVPGQGNPQWECRGFQSRANDFFPAWDENRVYYQGGAYGSMEANAPNKLEHLYVEGDQRYVTASKDHIAGGIYSDGGTGIVQAGFLQSGKGWTSSMTATHPGGIGTLTFNENSNLCWLRINYLHDAAQGFEVRQDVSAHNLRLMSGGSEIGLITQLSSTTTFGRTDPQGAGNIYINRLFVGTTAANARQFTFGTAPPTTGQSARGDFVQNRNCTSSSTPFGWRCVTGGTNGVNSVWQAVYVSTAFIS